MTPLLQLLLHGHALVLGPALPGGRRLEGAGRGPGGGRGSAAAGAAGVPEPLRRALLLPARWPRWRPVSALGVGVRAAKGSQLGRPCSDVAARCPDPGPGMTTGNGLRSGMRTLWGLFQTWAWRTTKQVSPASWGRGMGAFLGTTAAWEGPNVLPCPGRTCTSCCEARVTASLGTSRGRRRSCQGHPCRAGPGAQEPPCQTLPSPPFLPLLTSLSSCSFLPSSFLSLVKEEHFQVALETVDTNVRVRGTKGGMVRNSPRSRSRRPPSTHQGRGLG